jgi:hypothetical protein
VVAVGLVAPAVSISSDSFQTFANTDLKGFVRFLTIGIVTAIRSRGEKEGQFSFTVPRAKSPSKEVASIQPLWVEFSSQRAWMACIDLLHVQKVATQCKILTSRVEGGGRRWVSRSGFQKGFEGLTESSHASLSFPAHFFSSKFARNLT